MPTYSVELFHADKVLVKTLVTTCREETLRYLVAGIKDTVLKNNISVDDIRVVFHNQLFKYKSPETHEFLMYFLKFFTRRLLKKCAEVAEYKGKLDITVDYNPAYSTYKVGMPGFVLNNPYFSNFYLGCIRGMANYLCSAQVDGNVGLANLKKLKTYISMLKLTAPHVSEAYPTKTDFANRQKALFISYENSEFLNDFLKKSKDSIYGVWYNGFQTWYEGEGKKLLPASATKSLSSVVKK